MRQERKNTRDSFVKFEDGVLRVDACMERFSTPRDSQYRTSFEDLPSRSFGLSAVREECRLMRDVFKLLSLCLKPDPQKSLDEFVEENRERLEEVS